MRRVVIAIAALLMLVGSGHWGATKARAETSVKDNKLGFSLPDLEGKKTSLADPRFKGKVVLVDIWGTWCPPCRKEIPSLVKLHEKYHDKGLEIIGVAFERGPEKDQLPGLKQFVNKNGIKYTVLYGGATGDVDKAITGLLDFHGFPTGVFIDRSGKVTKVEVGFDDSLADGIEAAIVKLLDAKN